MLARRASWRAGGVGSDMATTLPERAGLPLRKFLAADAGRGAKADRKPLAVDEPRRAMGRVVSRALELAQLTKQQASEAMGYGTDQSAISRWISSAERPQFDKLWAISPRMQRALVTAFAEASGDVRVRTVIEVPA